MNRNLSALISLAILFGGSMALSSQSVEAKASRNNSSRDRNYLVPPPPPYTPSMFPPTLAMMNAQAGAADAYGAVVDNPANPNSKYYTRNQGSMTQIASPNQFESYYRVVEPKILKQIDSFDSEISSHEKEIGKLLNL